MVPQISPLFRVFLVATRRHVSPCAIHECWLLEHSIVPKEPMDEIRVIVMQHLDETAMHKLSYTAWDMFAYPVSDKSNWEEDCLSYSPGAAVDLGTRMLGIWLVLHDANGRYQGMVRVLKFEGHMLAYDPLTNEEGWIPMRESPCHLRQSSYDLPVIWGTFTHAPLWYQWAQSPHKLFPQNRS